jgi:hypothetical protein
LSLLINDKDDLLLYDNNRRRAMKESIWNKAFNNALEQLKSGVLVYMMTFFVMTLLPMFYTVYHIKERGMHHKMEKLLSLMFIFTIILLIACASALLIINHMRINEKREEYIGWYGLRLICLESFLELVIFLGVTSVLFVIMSYSFMMDLSMFIKMLMGYAIFHSLILIQNVTDLSQ